MTATIIKAEGLGKLYRVGAQQNRYPTLRDACVSSFKRVFSRKNKHSSNNKLWALKDISFEIKRGSVVGIIGKNGAGKSTLLKILSHITEPTEGRVLLYASVGSLLEVGTGFHPELTGRENIFLNGAILGMKRAEVQRKFDDIVAFSEIGKFLDTPVKHYSSGMYVRLAFAVAAFMESDILLIDEVLTVGDAGFQKKCLGKMEEVAGQGRTVLFVSHDMVAIRSLCEQTFLLESGNIIDSGPTEDVINSYIMSVNNVEKYDYVIPCNLASREGNGSIHFLEWWIEDDAFGMGRKTRSCQSCTFRVGYQSQLNAPLANVSVTLTIKNNFGQPVLTAASWFTASDFRAVPQAGYFVCHFKMLPLAPGIYMVHLYCSVNNDMSDRITNAGMFEVIGEDVFGTGKMLNRDHGNVIVKEFSWSVADR